ncbi:hypothetical protein [Cyclobacterium roseum]|uniref:hypothetical protein n=1 Tax=Cyclobacterium roseum TaxID=2666137 RepID=UPI001F3FAC12|nr:hypothetical protein [Cyclobacterium roseum]
MRSLWKNTLLFVWLLMMGSSLFISPLVAQEDIFGIERKINGRKSNNELGNVFRNMVSNFSFELSTGAGYQQHEFDFSSEMPGSYPISSGMEQTMDLAAGDTLSLSTGNFAYPLNIGMRINVFDFISLGVGYGREWGRISPLEAQGYSFDFQEQAYTYDKLYGTLGLILWDAGKRRSVLRWQYRNYSENNIYMQSELKQRARQIYPWRFLVEGEFGSMMLRKSVDPNLSAPDPYYGLGLRLEYDFSEYTRAFIKPAVEFRSFAYTNPEIPETQSLLQRVYNLQVGVSISLPGTKRCKVGGCRVVMKHLHNGVEYRGSSIWNRQNRKVGQW